MVQPFNVAKSETMIHHGNIDDFKSVFSKPSTSRLQPTVEPVLNPAFEDIVTDNYEYKWNNLKELVNRVFDDLQKLSIQAQNQSLKKWFDEVTASMEVVEVKRSMKQQSGSPH